MHTLDLSMDHVTKIEGDAALTIHAEDGKVTKVTFGITEYKRFFTEAMKGKSIYAIPAHLSRVCGTCSSAHVMAAIEACEMALDIEPTPQTKMLRALTMHGLIVRDHALHLYLFAMPDIFGKDAFLEFDENDPVQHQMLHDAFAIKAAGNYLATIVSGRSIHATFPVIGGFTHFPSQEEVDEAIKKLADIREAAIRCVNIFANAPFHFDRKTNYMALVPNDTFGYIYGKIRTSKGEEIDEKSYRDLIEHVSLSYSQASAYKYKGESYLVGSLARLNVAQDKLHPKTKESLAEVLKRFPSTDIFQQNTAQAIEIVHSIDEAIDLLKNNKIVPEPIIKKPARDAVGIGVVEAPRGILYHRVHLGADGKIIEGAVIVPTNQNQLNIEEDVGRLVEQMIAEGVPKEDMVPKIENLIRAYDPCMSCAAHFLKVTWVEK
jgi:coenzyme F420-reducing hydrogenase alpha subunit